ncbi:MAG: PAS domain S-box protein [Desulfobacteraceae bacterium]
MPASHPPTGHRHPPLETLLQILKVPFLRNIFLACLVVALLLPLYYWIYISPSYRRMVSKSSEVDARKITTHIARRLNAHGDPLSADTVHDGNRETLRQLKTDFGLDHLKIYDPQGIIVYSSRPEEIGRVNNAVYFTQEVAKGEVYSQLVSKGSATLEGRPSRMDVVEVYVPVMEGKTFLGAFEIYYDISLSYRRLNTILHRSNMVVGLIALGMMAIVVIALFRAGSAILSHSEMDRALRDHHDLLEQRIRERTHELIESNKELQMEIMERRIAETNLSESEKRFRTLVDTIPHGIQEIDPDGTITFANPAHAQIYGCESNELVGTSIFDLAAGDNEKAQLRAHLAYLFEDQPHPHPWFGTDRTKDGRTISTQVDWDYKRDVQGRVLGLITVISDITHRKQAEKALLDNLNFMNTLIDTIPNPVFYKDKEGLYLGCNVAYARTLGLEKDEILGRRLVELESTVSSEMADYYHRQDLGLLENPGVQRHIERVLCADGAKRDFILSKATFSDADDQVAGMVGIMLDITEHKKVEKALKESKNLFDAFMRHLPGLAFMKDPEGRYLYVNDAFDQLTGVMAGENIGRKTDEVWDPLTAGILELNDAEVMQSRAAGNRMEDVRLPDGRERHLLTARFPIFQDGNLFALGGISIDITDRTIAQRERRQLELQLQQTQKMEALGTLAGGIAHDFNNILAAIIGYTEIAVADSDKESAIHGYLTRVLESGERARSLIKQILAFSRQGDMEPKPVQLKLIVKEVLKLLRASLPATIDIVQEIHTDGAVMADPTQLHQVMMNLGTNAGYAIGREGGTLTTRLEAFKADGDFARMHGDLPIGDYLKLSVSDTGKGISAENLAKIFDPFFTTKPKGEGTGMGLSVVHGIVTGLGGRILVDSVPGQGTRFDVFLPALPEETVVAADEEKVLPTGSERILFVDDEPFQTDMLKHLLGLLGYKVETRNNGPDAIELFEKDPHAFDLVITDMIMPKMTGDQLSEKLLAIRPDLPIILATGYSEGFSEAKAKALGLKAYALKPLVMEELSKLIRQVLDDQD